MSCIPPEAPAGAIFISFGIQTVIHDLIICAELSVDW